MDKILKVRVVESIGFNFVGHFVLVNDFTFGCGVLGEISNMPVRLLCFLIWWDEGNYLLLELTVC